MTNLIHDPDSFTASWGHWLDARKAALRAPDGPATLTATYWLDESNTVPGVPGTWENRKGDTVLLLPVDTSVVIDSEKLTGDITALVDGDEIGPRIRLADLTVQVTTRLGRRAVRVFDHARSEAVAGVDRFEPSPEWLVEGRYTPAVRGSATVSYEFALEAGPREVPVPGVVGFELGGRTYETEPFLDEGTLLLVFADRTTGELTKPPSRFLTVDLPDGGLAEPGIVELDFNRAFLPPCAFSDEFNCPLPPAGHRFDLAITAGERFVNWRSS
jgi:uncharacterized protein (DUF1684 family)